MAAFEYTYASWDKLRPPTLGKTGLGDALKKYEAAKAALRPFRPGVVDYYDLAVRALSAVEKIRTKAIADCGSNPAFKSAKNALSAAPLDVEKKTLAAMLGNHMVNVLGTFPKEAAKHKEILEERVKLLETALELYQSNRPVPEREATVAKQNAGKDSGGVGNPTFPGQGDFRAFLGGRSGYRALLPDIVKQCEDLKVLTDELPGLTQRVNQLAVALKPYMT